jgi:hypothetical protein
LLSQERIADKLVEVLKEKFLVPFCYYRVDLADGKPVDTHLEETKIRIQDWATH